MKNTLDTTEPAVRRIGWKQFRFVVAALLLAAAAVKILNMRQILVSDSLLGTMPRLVAVTAFETALATGLMIGNQFWSWLMTLTTFAIFLASSVYAMATDQSCGCFGEQLNSETIVVIDVVVLLLTVCLRPARRIPSQNLIRQLTTIAVLSSLVAGAAVWRYEVLVRNERSRFLIADLLIGRSWPLTGQKDPQLSELSSGKWMILIARQDCSHCQHMVTRYFSDPNRHRPGERTAVFVFGGDDERWRFQFDSVTLELSDKSAFNWTNGQPYVVNPAVFLVDNGIVVDAAEGADTDQFIGALWSDPGQKGP